MQRRIRAADAGGLAIAFTLIAGVCAAHADSFTILHAFNLAPDKGIYPYAPLVADGNGYLFGTTSLGGPRDQHVRGCKSFDRHTNGCGSIFRLGPKGNTNSVRWQDHVIGFVSSNIVIWKNHVLGLARDKHHSNGFLFSIDKNGSDFKIVWDFSTNSVSISSQSSIAIDAKGSIFGVASDVTNAGSTIFKIDAKGQYSSVYNTVPSSGYNFITGITLSRNHIYGILGEEQQTTFEQSLIKVDLKTSQESTLYTCNGATCGNFNLSGSDRDENLYGIQFFYNGGFYGNVIEFAKAKTVSILEILHQFPQGGGLEPSSLTVLPDGTLIGTAANQDGNPVGGVSGELFKISGDVFTLLHNFPVASDQGSYPQSIPFGGLLVTESGTIYGTTEFGGDLSCTLEDSPAGCGVIYRYTP